MATVETRGTVRGNVVELDERPTSVPDGARVRVRLEVSPVELSADEITDCAATYVFDTVGDAAAVAVPERIGDRWRVPVMLAYRDKLLGELIYTREGELVRAESDAPRAMRERSRED